MWRDLGLFLGMYRDMIVTFTFQRRLGFYLINFYVPCVMMVIMSWLVFWMDRDNIGDRIALGITTVLTVVFLLGSGNATVPRVSYPKAIDWYLMTSLIFVFVALMMCLLIFRYERGRRPGNDNANSMGHPDTTGTQVRHAWFLREIWNQNIANLLDNSLRDVHVITSK